MKRISLSHLLLILAFVITGCTVSKPKAWSNQVTPSLITTSTIHPSQTPTPRVQPAPTPTSTTVNTLEPMEAEEVIMKFLQEPVSCAAPCFWGIVPGQTTFDEAKEFFRYLGIKTNTIDYNKQPLTNLNYQFDSGLSVYMTLAYRDRIVESIQQILVVDIQKTGERRDWLAYSPQTLIKQYGQPNRIDFAADWGPGPFFSMLMYFNAIDLVVEYSGDSIIPAERGVSQICPLTAQFDSVWLWLGKNPHNPPGPGVPLEDVTTLTIDEFARLMGEDPEKACFLFDGNAYKIERK